jgi:hypothetical protein
MKYVDELNEAARRREVSQTHHRLTIDASYSRVYRAYPYIYAWLFCLTRAYTGKTQGQAAAGADVNILVPDRRSIHHVFHVRPTHDI